MRDPVSNFLTSIKNAAMRKKESVDMPSSYLKEEMSKVLFEEGFVSKYEVLTKGNRKILRIILKYILNKHGKTDRPIISDLKQISKPGKRFYTQKSKIPKVQSGFGICIISTPLGVMSGENARKKNVGGEVLAYVY